MYVRTYLLCFDSSFFCNEASNTTTSQLAVEGLWLSSPLQRCKVPTTKFDKKTSPPHEHPFTQLKLLDLINSNKYSIDSIDLIVQYDLVSDIVVGQNTPRLGLHLWLPRRSWPGAVNLATRIHRRFGAKKPRCLQGVRGVRLSEAQISWETSATECFFATGHSGHSGRLGSGSNQQIKIAHKDIKT